MLLVMTKQIPQIVKKQNKQRRLFFETVLDLLK